MEKVREGLELVEGVSRGDKRVDVGCCTD